MGVIAKQSIKGTVYTYAGAVLGFVNTGLLMPKFLETNQVGLINLLVALTLLFANFANLGMGSVNVRIFPFFRDEKEQHHGIMMLGAGVVLAGIFLSLIVFFCLQGYFKSASYDSSGLLSRYIFYVPVLFFLTSYIFFFSSYFRALFDALTDIFLREFLVRLLTFFALLAYIFHGVDFKGFVLLYVLAYTSPLPIMLFILKKSGQLYFRLPDKKYWHIHKKEIFKVAFWGIVAGFSGMAVANIDKTMVTGFLGLEATGVYSVCFYFGVLIIMPARALSGISAIVVAEAWSKNDREVIRRVYKKSTVNLFLVGSLLYVGILINLDNIFLIIPKYASGRGVIIFIGAGYLFQMLGGMAGVILSTSAYYRVSSWMMLAMILLVTFSNLVFIPRLGLVGAAWASLASIILVNVFLFLFLYVKFKLQPYNYKHLLIVALMAFSLLINQLLPQLEFYLLDIFVRSSIIVIIYISVAYIFKISEDACRIFDVFLNKLHSK
ncbi:MAG: hypothetical protein CSB06_02255 [Bacteroidia bacterium]|nr:MAG: hypothetical protein CSB06_02255 [Bacteroidia bacterium]